MVVTIVLLLVGGAAASIAVDFGMKAAIAYDEGDVERAAGMKLIGNILGVAAYVLGVIVGMQISR